jgi:hypothetical protein
MARFSESRFGTFFKILSICATATLISALVGMLLILFGTFPFSLLSLLAPKLLLSGLLHGLLFASPVTLIALPVVALTFRTKPNLLHFLLPLAGFAGGGIAMIGWTASGIMGRIETGEIMFVAPGMIAGLVGGILFARAFGEFQRKSS